jgi:hypothetical protein
VLIHTHSLDPSKIKPTGPKHNILKSDVLAAIGAVPESLPAAQAERADKLAHLDLSNIVLAAPAPPSEPAAPSSKADPAQEEVEEEDELLPISIPISLAPLLSLQSKFSTALGTAPELSTLLARAVALANTALPAVKSAPTADELFDAIVSAKPTPSIKVSNGKYVPLVASNTELSLSDLEHEEEDVYDLLTSSKPKAKLPSPVQMPESSGAGAINIFALLVPPNEEKRATVFLEKLRDVVEGSPAKLIGL